MCKPTGVTFNPATDEFASGTSGSRPQRKETPKGYETLRHESNYGNQLAC